MDQVSFSAEQLTRAHPVSGVPAFVSPGEGLAQLWVFGILITLKITANETGGAFALLEDLVPPGNLGPAPHAHTREDEYWFVADGELTLNVGGEEIAAPQGSFMHIRRGVIHGFQNRSEKFARMIAMYTPGKFLEWFVHVGIPTEGASEASFPGPVPSKEDKRKAVEWLEVYGAAFPPPKDQHEEL